MGDLLRAVGDGEGARRAYEASLVIAEQLASREPDRADYQGDLAISYERMAAIYADAGDAAQAQHALAQAIERREQLVQREPKRADRRRELAVCLVQQAQLSGDAQHAQRALGLLEQVDALGALEAQFQPLLARLRQTFAGEG